MGLSVEAQPHLRDGLAVLATSAQNFTGRVKELNFEALAGSTVEVGATNVASVRQWCVQQVVSCDVEHLDVEDEGVEREDVEHVHVERVTPLPTLLRSSSRRSQPAGDGTKHHGGHALGKGLEGVAFALAPPAGLRSETARLLADQRANFARSQQTLVTGCSLVTPASGF